MLRATVNGAACTQGHALLAGETRKMSVHEFSIMMETLGGMSAFSGHSCKPPGAMFGSKHFRFCPAPVSMMLYFSMEGKRRSMATSVTSLCQLSGWSLLTFLSPSHPFLCVLYFLLVYFVCIFKKVYSAHA